MQKESSSFGVLNEIIDLNGIAIGMVDDRM